MQTACVWATAEPPKTDIQEAAMARPKIEGLGYFPLDVNFFGDVKIRSLQAHFGSTGIVTYLRILCIIYEKGYYVQADDIFISCLAADSGVSVNKVREIITYSCKIGLFDKALFAEVTVLSSVSIQRRYQEARKRAKRELCVDDRLWLLEKTEQAGSDQVRLFPENEGDFSEKTGSFSHENHLKEKESKINITAEAAAAVAATPPPTRENLVEEFGERNVADYEERFRTWSEGKKRVNRNKYAHIRKWMLEDGVHKPSKDNSSFDVDEIMERILRKNYGGKK